MIKYIFTFCLIVGFSFGLSAQSGKTKIQLDKDYNGQFFLEFAAALEKEKNIQFYFFPGWVQELKIKQSKASSTLSEVLSATFEGTEYQYLLHPTGQVIISAGNPIQYTFNFVSPSDTNATYQTMIETSATTNFNPQLTDFETEWIVIGDPSAPEQKPKVSLNGYVINSDNGEPLEDALIYIEELKTGTTTDSIGYYELIIPQGRYQITFQSIGLKEASRKLKLYASGQMDVQMGALILNIEEVVVRANRKESVRGVQMGVEALKTETIKELPALMGEVDIVRSALMLPGVQTAGEFSAGINVRGGGADQNLILLNGAPVYNASHLFGFSSSFSPDVLEGFELYKSSIPAKFGGRISSVLDIQMKEGDMEKWIVRGGISPVTSRVTLEGPLVPERSSIIVSGRATYSNWILKRLEDAAFRNSSANYYDISARYNQKFKKNNKLDVSAYLSSDAFKLNGDTTFSYQNRNIVANYQHEYSEKLFGTFSGIFSQYNFQVKSEEKALSSFDLNYQINHTEGRAHFSFALNDKHQVNFGSTLIHYRLDPGQIQPNSAESIIKPQELSREKAFEGSLYLSDEWTINESFSLSTGLRYAQYFYLGPQTVANYKTDAARVQKNQIGSTDYGKGKIIKSYGGLEYRVALRYAFDVNTSLKAAFNRNRQYMSMLFNSATISPTATWKLSDRHILPQTGDQFSLGIFRNMFDDQLELSLEGYYKIIQDMIEYKAGAQLLLNENLETDVINGEGRAYGVEFLLKKNGRKLNGWLSYTYSRTRFRAISPFPEDQINQGDWFPANADKPHDFSLVSFYKISKRLSFSTNLAYSTGRPITIPVAKFQFANGTRLQYSKRNEFRVPDYFRWDISINLEGTHKLKKLAHSSWSFSIYNVTGRRNAYSIYFSSDGENVQGYKLSIFGRPFATLTYNFRF